MIHGISARVRCDHSLEVARGHLSEPGWPWAGPPGPRSTRLLRLRRCICDRVLLRVAEQGTIRLPSWRVIFEAVDGPASPALLDCVLTIESLQGGGTELVMRGQASAALVDDCGFVPDSLVRLAASACARAFLDHLGDAWATLSMPRRPFVLTDPEQPTS